MKAGIRHKVQRCREKNDGLLQPLFPVNGLMILTLLMMLTAWCMPAMAQVGTLDQSQNSYDDTMLIGVEASGTSSRRQEVEVDQSIIRSVSIYNKGTYGDLEGNERVYIKLWQYDESSNYEKYYIDYSSWVSLEDSWVTIDTFNFAVDTSDEVIVDIYTVNTTGEEGVLIGADFDSSSYSDGLLYTYSSGYWYPIDGDLAFRVYTSEPVDSDVTIHVIDGANGMTPLAGVTVGPFNGDTETTDSGGNAIFEDVPFGSYDVQLLKSDYQPQTMHFTVSNPTHLFETILTPYASVTFRALDGSNGDAPLSGVVFGPFDGQVLTNGSDGYVTFEDIEFDTYTDIPASKSGYTTNYMTFTINSALHTFDEIRLYNTSTTTSYVDAVEGSDSYAGTEWQPWQTIGHALSQAGPNDLIRVKDGIYEESGLVIDQDNVTLKAFDNDGTDADVVIDAGGSSYGLRVQARSVSILNLTIAEAATAGIAVESGGNNTVINYNTFEDCGKAITVASGLTGVRCQNNTIDESCGSDLITDSGANTFWGGNYYPDYRGYDLTTNGYGDVAYDLHGIQDLSPRMVARCENRSANYVEMIEDDLVILNAIFPSVYINWISGPNRKVDVDIDWPWSGGGSSDGVTLSEFACQFGFHSDMNDTAAVFHETFFEGVGMNAVDLRLYRFEDGLVVAVSAMDSNGDPVSNALLDVEYSDNGASWVDYNFEDSSTIRKGTLETTAPSFDPDDAVNVRMDGGYAYLCLPLSDYDGSGLSNVDGLLDYYRIRGYKEGHTAGWVPVDGVGYISVGEQIIFQSGEVGHYKAVLNLDAAAAVEIAQGAWWSSTAGGTPISTAADGETVYLCVSGAGPNAIVQFRIYECEDWGDDLVETLSATADAAGYACVAWTAEYIDDGFLQGGPEYEIRVTADGLSETSGELEVTREAEPVVDRALWVASAASDVEISSAVDGDQVYLRVETRGTSAGSDVLLTIYERDTYAGIFSFDSPVMSMSGTLDADLNCVTAWTVLWQKQGYEFDSDAEYVFGANVSGVSAKSEILSVVKGRYDTFLEVDNVKAATGQVGEFKAFLYKEYEMYGYTTDLIKDGLTNQNVEFYVDWNDDGDFITGEFLGSAMTSTELVSGDGHATLETNITQAAGTYALRAVFMGSTLYKPCTNDAVLEIPQDGCAGVITRVGPTYLQPGAKTLVDVVFRNNGNMLYLPSIDISGLPGGWDVEEATGLMESVLRGSFSPGEVWTNHYYMTMSEDADQATVSFTLTGQAGLVKELHTRNVTFTPQLPLPAPELISPADGEEVSAPVTLEWEDLSDEPYYAESYTVSMYQKEPAGWSVSWGGEGRGGWDETEAHSGLRSLQSRIPTESSGSYVNWLSEHSVEAEGDTQYTLALWVKTADGYTSGDAEVIFSKVSQLLGMWTPSSTDVHVDLPAASSWTQVLYTFTTESSVTSIDNVQVQFTGEGSLWVDDVSIYQGDASDVPVEMFSVTLVTMPDNLDEDGDVLFAWMADDSAGVIDEYQYCLTSDSDTNETWTSAGLSQSVSYTALADGGYRFTVRAIDNDRGDQDLASYSFSVGGSLSANLIPNPGFESPGVTWNGYGDSTWLGSGARSGTCCLKLRIIDSSASWECEPDASVNAGAYYRVGAWIKNPSAEGAFMMRLVFDDGSKITMPLPGGESDWTEFSRVFEMPSGATSLTDVKLVAEAGMGIILFDDVSLKRISDLNAFPIQEPETTISGISDGLVTESDTLTIRWSGVDYDGTVAGYLYSLDRAINDNDYFPFTRDLSHTFQSIPGGEHRVYVAAVDNVGLRDRSPDHVDFLVNIAPDTLITRGPWGLTTDPEAWFEWTSDKQDVEYSFRLEGSGSDDAWTAWSAFDTGVIYSNLHGSYTFSVKARDEYGSEDLSPASRDFMVNDLPTIEVVSHTSGSTVTLSEGSSETFSAEASDEDVLQYTWTVDGEVVSQSTTFDYQPDYDDEGDKVLTLSVDDGNSVSAMSWNIHVANANGDPQIMSLQPDVEEVMIQSGEWMQLAVSAVDPDGGALDYSWDLDGTLVSADSFWTCEADALSHGYHAVEATIVDDSEAAVTNVWLVLHNNSPVVPCDPSPATGVMDVAVNSEISWTGGDPDPGDSVSYDVYMETPSFKTCFDASYHAMAVTRDSGGQLVAWGCNREGQVGDGTTYYPVQYFAVPVSNMNSIIDLDAGYWCSFAVKSNGTVWGWGYNGWMQLGTDEIFIETNVPVQVVGLSNAVQAASGIYHSLALKEDGTVWSWGYSWCGQMGIGELGSNFMTNRPCLVSNIDNVVSIGADGYRSFALKADGTVWSWGDSAEGQAGNGSTNQAVYLPVMASGLTGVVSVAGGGSHTLALKEDGTVWSWGDNYSGMLGDGTSIMRTTPVQVSNLVDVVAVACGNDHSLALKSDGTVWGWGTGDLLGNGSDLTNQLTPMQVADLSDIVAISAGGPLSMAAKPDGSLWAWGANSFGEVGNGDIQSVYYPVRVSNVVVDVSGANSWQLVSENQSSTAFTAGVLAENTAFKWKIIATDNYGAESEGPEWTFTTGTNVEAGAAGDGLYAEYYDTMTLSDLVLTRVDESVDFNWGSGSPDALIGYDTFSVRWSGEVKPLYSETYTFYTRTDDGTRLWVNDELVIDRWVNQAATEVSGTITLTAGQKYPIVMEYYENGGNAVAQLSWSSTSQAKEIIPVTNLYSTVENTPPTVNAGADAEITFPTNTVALTGVVSDDGLPNPPATTVCSWTMQSGPNMVSFANTSSEETTATFATPGTYVLRLTASDGELSGYDEVTVVVNMLPQLATPTFSPNGGTYTDSVDVVISSSTSAGASIYYTTDGSAPNLGSDSIISGNSITLNSSYSGTVRAMAYQSGYQNSVIGISAGYTVTLPHTPPTITTEPTSQAVAEGQSATFSVVATGEGTLSYQWRKNGVNISGATAASYQTPATTLADNGAVYSVVVSSPYGSDTSIGATLTVNSFTGTVDFDDYAVVSYGGGQDANYSQYEVLDNGATLHLWGNNWKAIALPYTVTENTVLELDFESTGVEGEIAGIAFDNDLALSTDKTFQLWGTQTYGIQDFCTYSGSGVAHYVIPVGEYYTGSMLYIAFANDADSGQATSLQFKNIQVHEVYNNAPNTPSSPSPADGAQDQDPDTTTLSWSGGDPDAGDSVTYDVYMDAPSVDVAIASGQSHVMVISSGADGRVNAWGRNYDGQLGDYSNSDRSTAVVVSNMISVMDLAAGSRHTLMLKSDGTVWGTGNNSWGQLGLGVSYQRTNVSLQAASLAGVEKIGAGGDHSLAIKSDGGLWAWGYNGHGQLGIGSTASRNTPCLVTNITDVADAVGGWYHSVALKSDGTVWCWGENSDGQIGNGTTTDAYVPVMVSGLTGVVTVAAGFNHTMAVSEDGTVWAWGDNEHGMLGDGTTQDRTTPVQVSGLSDVISVAGGYQHSLALKADGTVWAWGFDYGGVLGLGNNYGDELVPVQVTSLSNIVAIACLERSSIAVQADGSVWGCGLNQYGQLGDGTFTTFTYYPVRTLNVEASLGAGSSWNLVSENQPGTTYDPGTLDENTEYLWQVVATDDEGLASTGAVWSFETGSVAPPQAAAPTFSPNGGTYTDSVSVVIASATPGATIYYTTDGSTPTTNSMAIEVGGSALVLNTDYSGTVRAIAVVNGYENSSVAVSASYSVEASEAGDGLYGQYYNNMTLSNLALARTDATIDFEWSSGSPDASIGYDTFSVRWSGEVKPRYSGTYTFYTRTDDGVRLWVDGNLIINQWVNQSATEHSGTITLTAGQKYSIVMQYYENGGGAVAQLSWSSASQAKEIIPQSCLFAADPMAQVATPAFSPDGGTYTDAVDVVISSATPGATIYYTTDGSEPTTASDSIASGGSITLNAPYSASIRAIADAGDDYLNSEVAVSEEFGDVVFNSCVGSWSFEESAYASVDGEVLDGSGAGNDGRAYNGATTDAEGIDGRAMLGDGTNDYVRIPNSSSLQIDGDLTLSFWIKPTNVGSARRNPLDKSYGGEFALTIETDGRLSYYHGTSRSSGYYWSCWALDPGTVQNDVWQHIVIVRDTTAGVVRSYYNGTLMKTASYSTDAQRMPSTSTYPVTIGEGYCSPLGGRIDEVQIYDRALSTDDVSERYESSLNYSSQQDVTIDNPNASVLTNYLVKLEVLYESEMQMDFDDLRFTDTDGNEQYSYWIQDKTNGESAIVWIKVPCLPVGETVVVMHYGNSSAVSASSMSDTADTSFWTPFQSYSAPLPTITDDTYISSDNRDWGGSTYAAACNGIKFEYPSPVISNSWEFTVKYNTFDHPTANLLDRGVHFVRAYDESGDCLMWVYRKGDTMYIFDGPVPVYWADVRNTSYSISMGAMTTGTEYTFRLEYDGANWSIYVNDILKRTLVSGSVGKPAKKIQIGALNTTDYNGDSDTVAEIKLLSRSFFEAESAGREAQASFNRAPTVPVGVSPEPGAEDVDEYPVVLQWSASDPDGDSLTYDVFFGTLGSQALVSSGQTNTSYVTGPLTADTEYAWHIVAQDTEGVASTSLVCQFTTTPDFGCVGSWSFEALSYDGTAGEVIDDSGTGNHGQARNGATTDTLGIDGRGLLGDGANDYVSVPNSSSLQVAGDMTLSFWIKPTNVGSARRNPLDKNYGGEFALTIETDARLSFYHGTGRSSGYYMGWRALDAGTIQNDEWQHIVIVRDTAAGVMRSYYNGVLKKTASYSTDPLKMPSVSTSPVMIGDGYCYPLGGRMDDVKIYNRPLNEDEVRESYLDSMWYDASSFFRKRIAINNTNDSALSEFQVKVDVEYEYEMQSDFDDLIFVSDEGKYVLPHWIEEKVDGDSATVWVKVSNLPVGQSDILMYYGNANAVATSDGDATFEFFDDFESSNFDAWSSVGSSWSISSTDPAEGSYCACGAGSGTRLEKVLGDMDQAVVEEMVKFGDTNHYHYPLFNGDYILCGRPTGQLGYSMGDAYANLPVATTYSADQWYKYSMYLDMANDQYRVCVDGEDKGLITNNYRFNLGTTLSPIQILNVDYSHSSTMYVDVFRVRKFAPHEPSSSVESYPEIRMVTGPVVLF